MNVFIDGCWIQEETIFRPIEVKSAGQTNLTLMFKLFSMSKECTQPLNKICDLSDKKKYMFLTTKTYVDANKFLLFNLFII